MNPCPPTPHRHDATDEPTPSATSLPAVYFDTSGRRRPRSECDLLELLRAALAVQRRYDLCAEAIGVTTGEVRAAYRKIFFYSTETNCLFEHFRREPADHESCACYIVTTKYQGERAALLSDIIPSSELYQRCRIEAQGKYFRCRVCGTLPCPSGKQKPWELEGQGRMLVETLGL